jgi:hypothetical protein
MDIAIVDRAVAAFMTDPAVFIITVVAVATVSAAITWFVARGTIAAQKAHLATKDADSDEGGQLFRLKADSASDRLRTPFR